MPPKVCFFGQASKMENTLIFKLVILAIFVWFIYGGIKSLFYTQKFYENDEIRKHSFFGKRMTKKTAFFIYRISGVFGILISILGIILVLFNHGGIFNPK
jgi:hypothetical protein